MRTMTTATMSATTTAMFLLGLLAVLGGSGCLAHEVPTIRFANRDPVWEVDDRRPIPQPKTLHYANTKDRFDYFYFRPVTEVLSVPEPRRAANINSLDEVPDSTWFANRDGLTPDEIRRGPTRDDGPVVPLRISDAGRPGQQRLGVKDARGVKYILKFDLPDHPELNTGTDVVVQRLLWALGYHVPEDDVVVLRRNDLELATGATHIEYGEEVPTEPEDLEVFLGSVARQDDGRWRGLVSRYLDGIPVGGYEHTGVRKDDPNDVVPHEDRRELRGQHVVFSWLAHTDVKRNNWLDMWRPDPDQPGHGHLVHYLLDFDMAMGVMAATRASAYDGYAHNFDYDNLVQSSITFGLWVRPWERVENPGIVGVGRFESEHFDPAGFNPRRYFMPFLHRDRFDDFWAAKRVMSLSPEHIRAAVEAARFSEPAAIDYLTETLVQRQRKIGRYHLSRVAPLADLEVTADGDGGARLCATDLLVHHGLLAEGETVRHWARIYDYDGRARARHRTLTADADGRVCVDGVAAGGDHDGYTIVGFTVRRTDAEPQRVWAHLALHPARRTLRLIGLYRE